MFFSIFRFQPEFSSKLQPRWKTNQTYKSIFILVLSRWPLYSCTHMAHYVQKQSYQCHSHTVSSLKEELTNFQLWKSSHLWSQSLRPCRRPSFIVSWIRYTSHNFLWYFIKHSEKPKHVFLHKLVKSDLRCHFEFCWCQREIIIKTIWFLWPCVWTFYMNWFG